MGVFYNGATEERDYMCDCFFLFTSTRKQEILEKKKKKEKKIKTIIFKKGHREFSRDFVKRKKRKSEGVI